MTSPPFFIHQLLQFSKNQVPPKFLGYLSQKCCRHQIYADGANCFFIFVSGHSFTTSTKNNQFFDPPTPTIRKNEQ